MTVTTQPVASSDDRLRELLTRLDTVPAPVRSTKAHQRLLSLRLRAEGHTWAQIAHIFADRFGVNMRVACRLAHGYSQAKVSDQWNQLWPDEPKTFKNLSYWEQWPAPTGHTPSLRVLQRLAYLYECTVADLVSDVPAEVV